MVLLAAIFFSFEQYSTQCSTLFHFICKTNENSSKEFCCHQSRWRRFACWMGQLQCIWLQGWILINFCLISFPGSTEGWIEQFQALEWWKRSKYYWNVCRKSIWNKSRHGLFYCFIEHIVVQLYVQFEDYLECVTFSESVGFIKERKESSAAMPSRSVCELIDRILARGLTSF